MRTFFLISAVLCYVVNAQLPFGGAGNIANVFSSLGSSVVSGAQNLASYFSGSQVGTSLFEGQWQDFLKGKSYDPSELLTRKNIFLDNAAKIANFTEQAASGAVNFALKMNPLGDLSFDEFNKLYNGFKGLLAGISSKAALYQPSEGEPLPESVDWRALGAVTPVKDQMKCGACWAFSVAGALEGHTFRKTGKLREVSVQNLVDCSKKYGNDGCNRGLVETAFDYVQDNNGINEANNYPFEAKDGSCRHNKKDVAANCTGYSRVPEGDEKALAKALATKGPISVAINVVGNFQFYGNGVFYDAKCGNKPEDLTHAVLLVGYGKEPNGQKYWLLKNSYGTEWGEDGYFKLPRDQGNHCGVATHARYPNV